MKAYPAPYYGDRDQWRGYVVCESDADGARALGMFLFGPQDAIGPYYDTSRAKREAQAFADDLNAGGGRRERALRSVEA